MSRKRCPRSQWETNTTAPFIVQPTVISGLPPTNDPDRAECYGVWVEKHRGSILKS